MADRLQLGPSRTNLGDLTLAEFATALVGPGRERNYPTSEGTTEQGHSRFTVLQEPLSILMSASPVSSWSPRP